MESDIGTEITNSLDRLGRSAMQAALPMGSQKITGMADPTAATDGATKGYTDTLVASFFSTGDVKLTIKTVADTGWVMMLDTAIGNAGSPANGRANADTQPLFTLLYNSTSDANCPVFTSGSVLTTRAALGTAAAAFAANAVLALPKALGRALGVAGSGVGLTGRALALATGAETATLAMANLPAASVSISGTTNTWQPTINAGANSAVSTGVGAGTTAVTLGGGGSVFSSSTFAIMDAMPARTVSGNTANLGSGTAFSIMPPTVFLNVMIKL